MCFRLSSLHLVFCLPLFGAVSFAVAQPADETPPAPVNATESSPKPAPPNEEILALVDQLGHNDFAQRDQAKQALEKIGLQAREALIAGLKNSDPQIRRSCRNILRDVLFTSHQQKIEAFIADTKGEKDHDLPGWERFREIAGSGPEARQLFVTMQQTEQGLLASLEAGEGAVIDAMRLRLVQITQMMSNANVKLRKQPDVGTIATLMLVSSYDEFDLPLDITNNSAWYNTLRNTTFKNRIKENKEPALRALVNQWVMRSVTGSLVYQKLTLAVELQLKSGLDLAMVELYGKTLQGSYMPYAFTAIGKIGGRDYAAVFADMLEDQSVCSRRTVVKNGKGVVMNIEVRDVALAWLIHLTGQKHDDYLLPQAAKAFERLKGNVTYLSPSYLAFQSKEDRTKALTKWKEWVEKNPLKELPQRAIDAKELAKTRKKPTPKNAAVRPVMPNVVAWGKPDPDAEDDDPLAYADRTLVRQLSRARRLIEEERYADATLFLGEVLAAESDVLYRPDRWMPLARALKPEAELLVESLPKDGLETYAIRFNRPASLELAAAIESGQRDALALVGGRYFHTESGSKSVYILATDHLIEGRPLQAMLALKKLRENSAFADEMEPSLSVKLAASYLHLGMRDEAEQTLLALKSAMPRAIVKVGGEELRLFSTTAEALPWLEAMVGSPPPSAHLEGWLMPRGDNAGNKHAEAIIPWLDGVKLNSRGVGPNADGLIDKLMKARVNEHRAIVPSMHPIIVGDSVIVRTPTRMKSFSLSTGKLLWEAANEDALRDIVERSTKEENARRADDIERGLARRLWGNGTFGSISSDGSRVFAVEELSFGAGPDYRRLIVTSDGKQRLDPGWQKSHNILAAYDVHTGKLLWEVGGPKDAVGVELDNIFFLGPPAFVAGRLFVIGEVGRQTKLYQLDSATGKKVWSLTLEHRENQKQIAFSPYLPIWLLEPESHRSGAIGSSDGGVLVCPVSQNRFVAVNLATRGILWTYSPDEQVASVNTSNWQQMLLASSEREQTARWAAGSATLIEDRTLLTPIDSGKLLCIRTNDGVLLWEKPRGDGFYVGGAEGNVVFVVGLSSISGLDLATGNTIWKTEFPDGAVTSGRGYLAEGRYHTPLNTGEVAVVDATGRIVARTHAPDDTPPGNLAAVDGSVISQTVDSVWRFESVRKKEAHLLAQLESDPKNAKLIAQLGRTLLYQGKLEDAMKRLQASLALQAEPDVREALYDAVIEGLRIDFPKYIAIANELKLTTGDANARRLRQLAQAYSQAGQSKLAFDAWIRVFEQEEEPESLEFLSASWKVRRDRQMLARLSDLIQNSKPETRNELRAIILEKIGGQRPRMALQLLGETPEAFALRMQKFPMLAKNTTPLEAELMVRPVLLAPKAADVRTAHATLAQYLRKTGTHAEELDLWSLLKGKYADETVLPSSTGRQLYETLPKDDPLRKKIENPHGWPAKADKEEKNGSTGSLYEIEVELTYVGSSLGSMPFFVTIDNSGRNLYFSDKRGKKRWTFSIPAGKTNWRYGGGVYTYCKGLVNGRMLTVWVGNRVVAVDCSGDEPKTLWQVDTLHANPLYPNVPKMPPAQFRTYRQSTKPLASDLAMIAGNSHATFFQREDELLAVDPLTGKILWSQANLPTFADITADESYVYFTPGGAQETIVFNSFDGREVARKVLPGRTDRLAKVAGKSVFLQTELNAEATITLSLVDPDSSNAVWSHTLEPGSAAMPVGDSQIAVVQPKSGFTVYDASTGEVVMHNKIAPEAEIKGLFVWKSREGYIFGVQTPTKDDDDDTVVMNQFYLGPMFSGVLFAFNAKGEAIWKRDTPQHGCGKYQPEGSPVLVLGSQLRVRNGKSYRTKYKISCIDKRTGDTLHEDIKDGSLSRLLVEAAPKTNTVNVQTSRSTITFYFGGKKKTEAEEKPTAEEQQKKAEEEKQRLKEQQRIQLEKVQRAIQQIPLNRIRNGLLPVAPQGALPVVPQKIRPAIPR